MPEITQGKLPYSFNKMETRDGVTFLVYKCIANDQEYLMTTKEYRDRGKPAKIFLDHRIIQG